jgi:hypothetical protein
MQEAINDMDISFKINESKLANEDLSKNEKQWNSWLA